MNLPALGGVTAAEDGDESKQIGGQS